MIKYKWFTGDVDWKEYGGKFITKKLNNGDWDYWLVMSIYNTEGNSVESKKYLVEVSAIAPDAVPQKGIDSALSCTGIAEFYDEQTDYYQNMLLVEALGDYGISATLWDKEGNNLSELMREARHETQLINMLFGFYMDKQCNAIGNDGWDFISGNIGFK